MTDEHNSSNPFRKLAENLAARKAGSAPLSPAPGSHGSHGAAPGSPARPPRAAARPEKSRAATTGEDSTDAALFLDAVGRIVQAPKARREGGAGPRVTRGGANKGAPPAEDEAPAQASPPAQEDLFGAALEALSGGNKGRQAPSPAPSPAIPPAPSPDQEPGNAERDLFAKAMLGVEPVNGKGRALAPPAETRQAPPQADPAEALRGILEGRVEFALRHTDEFMEGFALGLDPLVMAKLRAGRYSPEKHLDLHGMNARQAHAALTLFVKDAYQRSMRCVMVVTGRGRNSPNGMGVLRPMLQQWLCRDPFKRVVLAFCTARPGDGGPGAAYVLLRKYKKSRGKILWERTPSDDDFPDV